MMITDDDEDGDAADDADAPYWVTIMVKLHACRSLTSGDDEIKIFAPLLQPHSTPFIFDIILYFVFVFVSVFGFVFCICIRICIWICFLYCRIMEIKRIATILQPHL